MYKVVPRQGFMSIGRKLSIPEPLKNGGHFIFSWGNVSENIRYYQFNMCIVTMPCLCWLPIKNSISSRFHVDPSIAFSFFFAFLKLEEAVDELR